MAEEQAIAAMRRIEQALLRIEAAADRPMPLPDGPAPDTALAERHAALRDGVAALLAKLDSQIAAGAGTD
ncbi:MAG: hypothetical protein PGN09_11945 [Sphingomonas fennica]